MKVLIFATLLLAGCAETVVNYPNGQRAFSTQADGEGIDFRAKFNQGEIAFHADKLNHSVPMTVQANGVSGAIGAAGAAAAAFGLAIR